MKRLTVFLILTIVYSYSVFAQQIKGTIKSKEDNQSLTGVSIAIKGNNKVGGVSDENGNFSLHVNPQDILTVSYIGYKTREVAVNNRTTIEILLEENALLMDEVVVVGYGTLKKSDVTGSVSSVKTSELTSAPSTNTAQALQGRVAGVVVQNMSGEPSGDVTIRIRGANSLTYGNDPLIVIDGIQGGNIGNLNPNDIESMEVLKDAAALSIYGSKGANGAILITTKSGKSGKLRVSYNTFVSSDVIRRKLPSLNAMEYATLFDEVRVENGQNPLFTEDEITALGVGTNWQDEIFRDGFTQSHNLSLSGGKEGISYFIAGGFMDKEGIVLNTSYKQYTLRSNLKVQASKKLNFGLNTFVSSDDRYWGDFQSAITSALQWSPTKPVYDSNSAGGYTQPGGGMGPVALYNPVGYAMELKNDQFNTSFTLTPSAEFKITDYLKVSSMFTYKVNSLANGWFDNQRVNNGDPKYTSGSMGMGRTKYIQNTNILSFDKKIGAHSINFTGVYEIQSDEWRTAEGRSGGIPVGLGYNGVQFGSRRDQPYSEFSVTAMRSFMGRINYGYKNRYLLSFSNRNDGASQLAEGHKFENFAAASAGWNIMEEPFMERFKKFMPELKLRGSYGSVGNAGVPAYSSQLKFYAGADAEGNLTLGIAQLENKGLKWERTAEANVGVDAKLFGGRLNLSVEYYDKKTTDLLMWQKMPDILGGLELLGNVGSVSNKGLDFSIEGTPVSTDKFKWTTNFIFNYNANKILALDGQSDTLVYSSSDMPGIVGSFVQIVGQPMGTFLGYEYAGVWKTDESILAAVYGAKPGDAKYMDKNKDGKIDKDDIAIIGNAQPNYSVGWNNSFSYRNFDFNLFWQGVFGNKVYNQNRIRREAFTSDALPTSTVAKDHWTPENQSDVPAFSGLEYLNSSRWVEDGSYLRLKNISLAYRLPGKILEKLNISSAKFYVSASNLCTITSYSGFDPEASMGRDAWDAGVDRGIYPTSKSFVLGLDITF